MGRSEMGASDRETTQYDVVVVGGGPVGCSAGVFTARDGLDTAIFDRGNASLRRCAYLENYLGFPEGIDIETFYALAQDHAEAAGCTVVDDLVESVERSQNGFVVESQSGQTVTSARVIAATRHGGEYLRPLGRDAMFETHEHDGEEHEHFDPGYADADGRTPIDGLYVASPSGERDVQAIVAAGQGAHVARSLLADHRQERGYPEGVLANRYDWLRPDAEFAGEWGDRDRWREWFDEHVPDDPVATPERLDELRERAVDRALDTRRSDDEIERLTADGHRALADHLEPDALAAAVDERVLEAVDDETLLAAVDDDRIRSHLESTDDTDGKAVDVQ